MEVLEYIHSLSGHVDRVWCLSWNFNGTLLASCGGDRTIRIWSFSNSTQKWVCINVIDGKHTRTIRCVAWSPCGKYLASAGFDGVVYIEEIVSKDPLEFQSFEFPTDHLHEIKSVSWSISGNYLASCARDRTVRIFDIEEINSTYCLETILHTEDVKSVKWHPIVDILVSSSYDNTIKILKEDGEDWIEAAVLTGHLSTVWNAEFNHDGNILASCSDDKTVRLWVSMNMEFTKWICASVLDGYHERVIYDLSWDYCSNLLATVSSDNSICIFRINDDNSIPSGNPGNGFNVELVTTMRKAHEEDINCCAWQPISHGRSILASGSDDFLIKLWHFIDPDMPID